MNRNCSNFDVKRDKDKCIKDRAFCKDCCTRNIGRIANSVNIVSERKNLCHIIIAPNNSGMILCMLKNTRKKDNKIPNSIITRSVDQNTNYKTDDKKKPIDSHKEPVVFLMLW